MKIDLNKHRAQADRQLNKAWEKNEAYIKDRSILNPPEIRFYDFLFLNNKKDNSQFFVYLENLPEWADVAKKSKSNAFLVTDKTTIKILKSTKLPPESGMTDKTYFYYLRKGGIKFTTIEKLIENLPRDKAKWKNLHDRIKPLVDNGTLHPVAFRDLARPIVMMGSIGDHAETVTVQKELDILVRSDLAQTFKGPGDLLPPFSIQGTIQETNIDDDPLGRTPLIKCNTAHGTASLKERNKLKELFKNLAGSVQFYVAKGTFLYTGLALENALELVNKLENGGFGDIGINTNKFANSLENLWHLAYGEPGHQTASVMNPLDFGIFGSFHSRSWWNGPIKNVGKFVPLINNSSQIGDFINPLKKPSPLSWDGIKNITKYLGERVTPPENKPLALTPSENKPLDRAFWRQFIKNAAILMVYYALPPLSSAPAISAGNRGSAVPHLNQSSDQVSKLTKPSPPTLKSSKPQPEILLRRVKEDRFQPTTQPENQPNNVTTGSQATKLDTNITQSRGS